MDRREYTQRVLAQLPLLLEREKADIRGELDGHMEDHMADLMALGWEEALCEERTLAAMGDPEEMGRELSKQYQSFFWVVLGDIVTAVLVIAVALLICSRSFLGVVHSLQVRLPEIRVHDSVPDPSVPLDIKLAAGDDVVRVYGLDREGDFVRVYLCAYDRIPGGIVSTALGSALSLETSRGKQADGRGYFVQNMRSCVGYYQIEIDVQPEDMALTLRFDQYGEHTSVSIPLPEVAP